jgi:hypothetical protein
MAETLDDLIAAAKKKAVRATESISARTSSETESAGAVAHRTDTSPAD